MVEAKTYVQTFHALAAISIIGGLVRVFVLLPPPPAVDVMTRNIVMIQYVLWAILFEVAAANFKS